ncbi:unnamed protein product [Pylaiella littoralis]
MDSVRFCAAKLGYTVIDRKITSKVELEVIARVCAKDKTKILVFSDEDDVKKDSGVARRVRKRITGVSHGLHVGWPGLLHQQVGQAQDVARMGAFAHQTEIPRVCHLL